MTSAASGARPGRVAVVGAGMVGLSTAWFLREHGVEVTVYDREGVAAGASWGNAGWLTPGLVAPLPEPAVLRYGLRAVLSPASPVYVPPSASPRLLRFLAGFALHSTAARWRRAMAALVPVNRMALESFDLLAAGGVAAPTVEAKSFVAAYRTARERAALLEELAQLRAAGQDVDHDVLDGEAAREAEPALSPEIGAAVRLHGQRYIDPGAFAHALAASVRARGGGIRAGAAVTGVHHRSGGVAVELSDGTSARFDAVVLAGGVWLGELGARFGIRRVVQAGRGYSFSVPVEREPAGPVYFPAQRVACTPLGDRLRVAGMMEFRRPGAPLDGRRIKAVTEAARPLLRGVDLDARRDEWVGSRPCTADGLPLIGVTRSPRVFAAGGHGMWGVTLGPVTGRLLAERVATGREPAELAPFDPLR
ncbi:FAD-dependent oxidoreductase [Streptomyces sp. TRM 70361]|uniref:NAD(P)/FAD-dependent oxidoreductase n=1 Tax=Streptomyces sp. TRM 70361 TaxID=3116553 RepID=UPI002E7AD051|nr:FAD-dependent oxidoreductase [Streptomyces sp. TRM 70361]MEE1937909.1 FAD-dependent oxidoreductase [Streptomyces sp. TRM 70361]